MADLRARYDLVVFDLDGTLIEHHEPIWKTLHGCLGSDLAERKRVMAAVQRGELGYEGWFAADLDMLRAAGATRDDIAAVLADLTPAPGARELVRDLRKAGARVAVLSGGIDLAVEVVFPGLVLDALWINRIEFDAEGRISGGQATPYDQQHKATGLTRIADDFGIPLARTAFVGDGDNDVDIARAAGFSIAWGLAPEALKYVSHVYVEGPDLAEIRPLLFDT